MAMVKIDYGDLKDAAKRAKDAADYYEDYADGLQKKVYDKLEESKLPESDSAGNISAARSAISSRMRAMRKKKDYYTELSSSITTMRENIETHEGNVVKQVRAAAITAMELENRNFWDTICEWLYGTFCVDLANWLPFTRAIGNKIKQGLDWVQKQGTKVYNWFRHGEGRYVLDIVLGVLEVVAAIVATIAAVKLAVAAVVSTAITGGATAGFIIAAVASVIATTLTVVDKIVSVTNDIKALQIMSDTGDPGQARFYGTIEGVEELTQKRDYGDAEDNAKKEKIGKYHTNTRKVAEVVAVVAGTITSAGLTPVKVKDPKTGKLVLKTEFDAKQIKPNLIKAAQEKLGLQKINGKWKFSIRRMFTSKKNAHGVMDKADVLKKNLVLDWQAHNYNLKVIDELGPGGFLWVVNQTGVDNYAKQLDELTRKRYKILSNVEKYAKKPGKINKQIDNWDKMLDDSKSIIERAESSLKIIESSDYYISDQAGLVNDTYEKIKDIVEKIGKKEEGAA